MGLKEEEQQKCTHVTCVTALLECVRVSHTSKMPCLTEIDDRLYLRARRKDIVRYSTVGSTPGTQVQGRSWPPCALGHEQSIQPGLSPTHPFLS